MDGEGIDQIIDSVLKDQYETGTDEACANDWQDPRVAHRRRPSKQEQAYREQDSSQH